MSSTLKRLFGKARENFTTEALAAAIRSDPRPFLIALGEPETTSILVVATQVPIKGNRGHGFLDLVVEVGLREDPRRYWFEVKVKAGEHGDQIEKYLSVINDLPEEGRPRLLILGTKPLRKNVQWISWQSVRHGIESIASVNSYWTDIQLYLEEIGMADVFSDPFTTAELVSLRPANRLLGKVARLLLPFSVQSLAIWPQAKWPLTEKEIRTEIGRFFLRDGVLAMNSHTPYRAGVATGVCSDESTGDALLRMWIWLNPSYLLERERLWMQATSLDSTTWSRVADWELLFASRRLGEFKDADDATGWLLDRLRDLDQSGVLGILPTLSIGKPGEGYGEDEADSDSEP